MTGDRTDDTRFNYDVFISHASEDKGPIVDPLAEELRELGLDVWYDEFELTIGDSVVESIDHGLATSEYGVVVLSDHFFEKNWTQYELNGLISRQVDGDKVILPLWYNIDRRDIQQYSPALADVLARKVDDQNIPSIAEEIHDVVKVAPDSTDKPTWNPVARAGRADESGSASSSETELTASELSVAPSKHAASRRSIRSIEAIGPARATELANAGITTIDDLLNADPSSLANVTSLDMPQIEEWIVRSHPDRDDSVATLDGIGPVTVQLLDDIGIDSIGDLALAAPHLAVTEKGITEGRLASLISQARGRLLPHDTEHSEKLATKDLEDRTYSPLRPVVRFDHYVVELEAVNITSIFDLAECDPHRLSERTSLFKSMAELLVERAREMVESTPPGALKAEERGSSIRRIPGIGRTYADELRSELGIGSVTQLAAANVNAIVEETSMSKTEAKEAVEIAEQSLGSR